MTSSSQTSLNLLEEKLNNLIENVFLFTIDKNPKKNKQLVFLEEAAEFGGRTINLEILEQALFERLMLINPGDFLIPSNIKTDDTEIASDTKVISYLYRTFNRNELSCNENDSVNKENCGKIRELILRNVSTAIKQPALYEGQQLSEQILEIFKDMDDEIDDKAKFLSAVSKEVLSDDDTEGYTALQQFLLPVLTEAHKSLRNASLGAMEVWITPFLMAFSRDKTNPRLGEIILDFTTPPENSDGIRYSESLFGQLLSLSIMPKNHGGPYEFFDNMQTMQNLAAFQSISASLWNYLNILQDSIHDLFKSFLLLGGNAKEKILKWIGSCLNANAKRGQIWNAHTMMGLGAFTSAPDSFMIGLAAVLLRLCKPLFKPSLKVLIVDPTYCAVKEDQRATKMVHMKDIEKETCLLPCQEGIERIVAEKYNFVTECFFMTHKAIDLGYRVCIEKLIRMSREVHQLQAAHQDAAFQGGSDVAGNIMQLLTSKTQQCLCLQNLIMEPNNDQYLMQFYEATSIWLTQILNKPQNWYNLDRKDKGYAPQIVDTHDLPPDNDVPQILNTIPEFILENIVGYLTFVHHFDQLQTTSVRINTEAQNAIFTMILLFMGSAKRVRNPHVRARLAEGLESLLPNQNKSGFGMNNTIFINHPHRLKVVENLLSVFVGIEMTGQSVEFEQKFNYRRPMYVIMDYLWKIPEQKACFK